jgi:hypothetical protein
MTGNRRMHHHQNGRMMGTSPSHALFNIFLPEVADSELGEALQCQIKELVAGTGATGYTLLPPSVGLWAHQGVIVEDRVHPMQIVAEDTVRTCEQIERFASAIAALLDQQWLYIFRVPVVVNEAIGPLS